MCNIDPSYSGGYQRDSIYSLKLSRKGINLENLRKEDLIYMIKVSDAMFKNVIYVSETNTVKEAGLLIKETTHRGFPVLDDKGLLKGIVTHQDINKALSLGKKDDLVRTIMTTDISVCYQDETLKAALEKMGERNIGRIPVVEHEDQKRLVGLITRKGIIEAYNKEFLKRG